MATVTWSVVWEAVAAVGTVGAVVWAVYTTLTERQKRTETQDALTEEQAASRMAKRREHAEHIAVWFEMDHLRRVARGRPGGVLSGTALVGNYSSAPIFNVAVSAEAVVAGKRFALGNTNVVPPGNDPWRMDLGEAAEYRGQLRLCVDFQDVAGVRWRRWSNGDLEDVAASVPGD
jgi:hypothetical protein